jgi:hypothetical protein
MDITFADCDLPSSRLGNPFLPIRASLKRCTFDRCNLDGSTFARVDFEDCSFVDTTLERRWSTDFSNCTFRSCRFERGMTAVFRECTFVDVGIDDTRGSAHFTECAIERMHADGPFRGKFVSCSISSSDFSGARFGEASGFSGGVLNDVSLPTGSRGFVVPDARLLDGFQRASSGLRPETAAKLLAIGRAFQQSEGIGAVEDDYFQDLTIAEQNAVLEAFLPFRVDRF